MAQAKLYVVQVRSGTEDRMCRLLERALGDAAEDVFTPSYEALRAKRGEWRTVSLRLLPGYVFVQTRCPETVLERLRAAPVFARLLGAEGEKFMPLSADEVAWLTRYADLDEHVVRMSSGVIEGDRVIVLRGPLKGHEFEIKKIDRHKREAELEVPMLGRVKRIRVGLEIVSKR